MTIKKTTKKPTDHTFVWRKGKKTPTYIKAKIVEAKINSNAQWTDIAKELGVPERTVQHILQNEFAGVCVESKAVADLVTRNDNLHSIIDDRIEQMILNKEENIRLSELVSARDSVWKQNQVAKWLDTNKESIKIEWSI